MAITNPQHVKNLTRLKANLNPIKIKSSINNNIKNDSENVLKILIRFSGTINLSSYSLNS